MLRPYKIHNSSCKSPSLRSLLCVSVLKSFLRRETLLLLTETLREQNFSLRLCVLAKRGVAQQKNIYARGLFNAATLKKPWLLMHNHG
jgi:hypothetical protein